MYLTEREIKAQAKRRYKTLQWLEKLAVKKNTHQIERLKGVFFRYGRAYATDNFIVAYVEWEGCEDFGCFEWEQLESYELAEGDIICKRAEMQKPFADSDFFTKLIPQPNEYCNVNEAPVFDASLVRFALEVFQVNGLDAHFGFTPSKMVIAGHDKHVSVCVVCMGKKVR